MTKLITLALMLISLSASTTPDNTITLTPTNSLIIKGSISQPSMDKASKDLIKLVNIRANKKYKLYIVIDSGGGSVFAGKKFIRFVKSLNNIHTICIYCASMAHAISQGVPGTRYGITDAIMMAHRAKGGFSGQFGPGEVESRLQFIKSVVQDMEQTNADRIGISLKEYRKKVINEWWTFGKESIKQNVLDKLVNVKCSLDLINKKVPSTRMTLFGPVKSGEKSACPLI